MQNGDFPVPPPPHIHSRRGDFPIRPSPSVHPLTINSLIDFTKWKGFPEYAQKLKNQGLHLNLILDPGIEPTKKSWLQAKQIGASFIEWPNHYLVPKEIQNKYPMANETKVMFGVAWPDSHVAWPDFFDSSRKTETWWAEQFIKFQKMVRLDIYLYLR